MENLFAELTAYMIGMKEFLINLSLAIVIGIVVGIERHKHKKVIGVRTATLIMIGSFIYAHISLITGGDPSRIIAQIVTGVGFIGGGIIFKNGVDDIRHLTTAVLVWTLAAIGSLVALSLRVEAITVTIIIMAILQLSKIFIKDDSPNEK